MIMPNQTDNSLARFERRPTSYPLTIVGFALFTLLAVGLGTSIRAQNWIAAGLFFGALIAFVVAAFVNLNRNRRLEGAADRKYISWDSASPELQRQNVNIEVHELARLLGVGSEQMTDLLSAYVVAEDLALRHIQQEESLPLLRHVSIGKAPFDAILVEQDMITCIEVSFLVVPDVRREKIESMLKRISLAKKNLAEMKIRLRLKLMLVLVTQLSPEDEEQLRGVLITRRFSETPVDIDIRLLDFETLQKVYVAD